MKNIDKALLQCYVNLYKKANPSADFNELLKSAPLDDRGKKIINYNDYTITEFELEDTIKNIIKEFKIPKRLHKAFKNTIYLGVSPRILKTD